MPRAWFQDAGHCSAMKLKQIALKSFLFAPLLLAQSGKLALDTAATSLIAADMAGSNEARPQGVPVSYRWSRGPTITMDKSPNGWRAITAWGVITVPLAGNPAANTRVNIRGVQLFLLSKSSGKRLTLQNSSQPDGAEYMTDFAHNANRPANIRKEPDGTVSVTAGEGWCFHFYPAERGSIDPDDVGGILAMFQARLIVDNPSLPDDRAIGKYIASAGADYYPALTGGWPGNLSYNPGIGTGKFKFVKQDWRFYAMTTMTAAQLSSNPPPLNLAGVNP